MDPQTAYQCSVCKISSFKSRSDWLVHLVLATHSKRVIQNFKQWQDARKGDLYVITDLASVENSMLLEYIAAHLRTFTDIVFFKPRANVALLVGDARELEGFSKASHTVGGVSVQIKSYQGLNHVEWKFYFGSFGELGGQGQAANNNPSSQSVPVSVKRKVDDDSSLQKPAKIVKASQPPAPPPPSFSTSLTPSLFIPPPQNIITGASVSTSTKAYKNSKIWEKELEEMESFIFMSSEQIESRRSVITHLTDLFKPSHPNCKMVPVGADILGYSLGLDVFMIYFDSKGLTGNLGGGSHRVNSEASNPEIEKLRTHIFVKLKNLQTQGIFSDVECQGANSVVFKHLLFDLKCNLLLKPFMMAQTARLCKHLYSMDERVAAVLNMVVYWAKQRNGFSDAGLNNPYVIYWLVYFFMMKTNVLPPVAQLQKSCPFEIVDRQNNVAFSCNESEQVIEIFKCNKESTQSYIELLLQWFVFIDDLLGGDTQRKGESRRHSLICPRFVQLIDKRKFRVCWEKFKDKRKKHLTSEQKRTRRLWKQGLIDLGFEENMWGNLLGLKLPDTLCIQHPLYISENISLSFDGPFSKRFFEAISQTRVKLTRLLAEDASMTSILQSLSNSMVF